MPTSPVTNASQGTLHALSSTARALVIGLAWAAVMLFVAGFWMRAKYGDGAKIQYYVFLTAGFIAAGLAAWQAFTVWFKTQSPDEKANTLAQQRRLFSLIFMAAGLGLIGLAIALGFGRKPDRNIGFILDNLGESIGVLLFGLIALGTGYAFSASPAGERTSSVQFVAQQIPILKFAVLIFGILAIGTFVWLVWTNRDRAAPGVPGLDAAAAAAGYKWLAYLPELFALVAVSVLCIACFLWLNTGAQDDYSARLFVLVFGGTFGLILFCYSLGRGVVWRQDILLGGLIAWQGENAWRFWTVVYLQFAALALMFGSFNLAKADMRANVHLRRVMYGYDAIVQTLLLLEILAVLNIVLSALAPYTFDWTKNRGAYAIAESSKNLIAKLKKETNIVVIMSPNDPVYRDVKNLMDNFQANSAKLKVEYLSPDNDPTGYSSLSQLFPKIQPADASPFGGGASGRGVLMINGPMPQEKEHKVPYAFVKSQNFTEEDRDPRDPRKSKRMFKGEGEIIKELQFLVQEKKRKIYVLQGNEEPDVNFDDLVRARPEFHDGFLKTGMGFGALAEKLNTDNYEVFGLSFGPELPLKEPKIKIVYAKAEGADRRKEVPKDCDTLIVAPTSKELPDDVVAAVERYMEQNNGKLLLFLDVIADKDYTTLVGSGLERMLRGFGVEVLDGYALAVRRDAGGRIDAATLLATAADRSENPLARAFIRRSILMPDSARILKPAEMPGRFKAEPVLQLEFSPAGGRTTLIETDLRPLKRGNLNLHLKELDDKNQLRARESAQPVIVAVAVSEDKGSPRMVVVGDTEFVGNLQLQRSPTSPMNYSFTVSALEWMGERESIGARPKVTTQYSIDPSVDTLRMILAPGWLMLLTLTGIGIAIWVVRRR